jgi:hypothetical protein
MGLLCLPLALIVLLQGISCWPAAASWLFFSSPSSLAVLGRLARWPLGHRLRNL